MTDIPKVRTTKAKRRVGRGYGSRSGGHTSGRGNKGQKARSSVHILFEGVKVRKSLLKRLPHLPGKNKFKAGAKAIPVNVDTLNSLRTGTKVDLDTLVKEGIVEASEAKEFGVKILGRGKLEKKLTVALPASKKAQEKIEKAGGKVE